jgi:hypothetical protein
MAGNKKGKGRSSSELTKHAQPRRLDKRETAPVLPALIEVCLLKTSSDVDK